MKRLVLALGATVALTLGASLTVVGIGDTEVTLNCDDGSSVTLVVDAQTLSGLTAAVQAMLDYPAGVTCSLTQNSVAAPILGLKALAEDPKDMVLLGGQWLEPPPTPDCVQNLAIVAWKDASGTFRGTVHQATAAHQPCFFEQNGRTGTFTATIDTCVSVGTSSTFHNEGVLIGHLTRGDGSYSFFVGNPYFAYVEDIGEPLAGVSPDKIRSDFLTTDGAVCGVHPYTGPKDQLLNGNGVVKDSPAVAP